VAIQVSGSFGSRQEEARPRAGSAATEGVGPLGELLHAGRRDTVDQDFARTASAFLAEQGYSYTILDSHNLVAA